MVNGNWCTNDTAPGEDDGHNNYNNVLYPDDIKDEPVETLSSAAPQSSTAALAGAVPKETQTPGLTDLPGAFPETPANDLKTFSVNPIPASAGAGNPIHLEPGEKVPDPATLTSNTVSSTATTDPASYEKADAPPPQLGPVVITPDAEREAKGGMFALPPVLGSLIPESSLPKDAPADEKDPGVTIQSAAPTSSTAALAANVPKEPRGVPEIVKESQKEADASPEASANPDAVQEKRIIEKELKSKVSEEPPAAQSPTATEKAAGTVAASAAGLATTFAGATYAAKDKAAEALGYGSKTTDDHTAGVPEVVTKSQEEAHAAPEASANPEAVTEKAAVESELLEEVRKSDGTEEPTHPAPNVPEIVADSQEHAHAPPEASAETQAVEAKSEFESELLREVKKTDEAGEPVPTVTAAIIETAPGAPKDNSVKDKPLKSSAEPVGNVGDNSKTSEASGLNASAENPAVPATSKPAAESSETAPAPKPATEQTQPTVTTGVESITATEQTTAAPSTPKASRPSESAASTPENGASTDKKKKRRSFFGKLKEKFIH